VVVGKGKLFWFFSVGFVYWEKRNVLDRAVDFSVMVGNVGIKLTYLFSIKNR